MPFPARVAFLVFVCLLVIGGYLLTHEPTPQPLSYHAFADQRPMLGVRHMLNVASNLPFLIVGIWGMIFMARESSRRPGIFLEPAERIAYWIYFCGLALTGIGSAYYHHHPNNDTLVIDRIGLAITFMALFTAIVAERTDWQVSPWLVGPMVILGIVSVLYWQWTDDLRFYFVVQFFPLVALPLLLLFFRPRYTGTPELLASLACYGLAKGLEILDKHVYTQAGFVSGHTLKHLVAGMSAYLILLMLQRRRVYV